MVFVIMCVGLLLLGAAALTFYMIQSRQRRYKSCTDDLTDRLLTHRELTNHIQHAAHGLSVKHSKKLRLIPFYRRRLAAIINRMRKTDPTELLPALKILYDNACMIENEWLSLRESLKALPSFPANSRGLTVIEHLCREMFAHSQARVTGEVVVRALMDWQNAKPLTLAELWSIPHGLKCVILNYLLCKGTLLIEDQARRSKGIKIARRLARDGASTNTHMLDSLTGSALWEALLSYLRQNNAMSRLDLASDKLNQLGISAQELIHKEHRRQTRDELWVSHAVQSLKRLSTIDWSALLETIDPIDSVLSRDAVYTQMDAKSRAYYRSRVQHLARLTAQSERSIADAAISLAASWHDDVKGHVGYYLLETEGMQKLADRLKSRSFMWRLRLFFRRNAVYCYRLSLCIGNFTGIGLLMLLKLPLFLYLPAVLLVSQTTRALLRMLIKKIISPRLLPRIGIKQLTDEQKTLVVYPTLLTSKEQALSMVRQLSAAFHGNPDPNLHFMLLGDFADSATPDKTADKGIMTTAAEAVLALNETLPSRFIYYQRQRTFDPSQRLYIARERKRGSLESLNRILTGREPRDSYSFKSLPFNELENTYAYVITLDSDTLLPPGAAYELIGAMYHPLHLRYSDASKSRGLSVIAPRMGNLLSSVQSRLSKLWGGEGGLDPYNAAQSDLYQDMFGRGSYCGKGIYRPYDFLQETEPFIPDNAVLSHDLLEGELAGCALASDTVLYDAQPAHLSAWMKRLHRWTRGDWQLLPWIIKKRRFFKLDALSRHKIWDNLRRSLLPLSTLLLLIYGIAVRHFLLFSLALLWALTPFSFGRLLEFALLPYRVFITADAILRTLWRLCVTRKHLLDWVPSHLLESIGSAGISTGVICQWSAGGFFILLSWSHFPLGTLTGALFAGIPFLINHLERKPEKTKPLSTNDKKSLQETARNTWLFFEKTVTANDCHLPPDNWQFDPPVGPAHRTSPTNIGFYLLSLVSAEHLGCIDVPTMLERFENTVTTLERMTKWKGHFYNWYDTQTLRILEPAFVSSVDSGNLCASLLACAQAVRCIASDLPARSMRLAERLDRLAWQTDMSALFDAEAGLFRIGYSAADDTFTEAHYDLMASEARLISFLGIMMRQAPLSHWFRLSRPMVKSGGGSMISWGGTMFEYLMPHLLLPLIPGSLLDSICKGAVKTHMRHKHMNLWGVSESGFYAFDAHMNYQYRAFGAKKLAMNPDAAGGVLAPYASALAVPLFPSEAAENLERMSLLGFECQTGFYEAIDFDSTRVPKGNAYRVIKSQMAHHQGMLLCALTNALYDDLLINYFMALPAAQAFQLLLEEPMPKRLPTRKLLSNTLRLHQTVELADMTVAHVTLPPQGQLLTGGDSVLFTDSLGNGFMASKGLMLTRFTAECGARQGIQFYIKDADRGSFWLAADLDGGSKTVFVNGRTVFTGEKEQIGWSLTCWADPLDGTFCHLLEIENLSDESRTLEAASFFIPVILNREADLAHPAFRELFIETVSHSRRTLCARRRPRETNETVHILTHTLAVDTKEAQFAHETQRDVFIGRYGDLFTPAAMESPFTENAAACPAPINPCMSIRSRFIIAQHGKASLLFATQLTEEEKYTPGALEERFTSPARGLESLTLAQTQNEWLLRQSGLSLGEDNWLPLLYPLLFYPVVKNSNPFGVSSQILYSLGLLPDRPVMLVCLSGLESTPFISQCLCILRLLRLQTVDCDLVFTAPEEQADINEYFEGITAFQERDRIKWFSKGALDEERLNALNAFAAVRLSDRNGAVHEQLRRCYNPWKLHGCSTASSYPSPLPETVKKQFNNGLGGFLPNGDYTIDLFRGAVTPAPWCHMLSCEHFGTLACESGLLFTYCGNSHHRRLTPWTNDPVSPRHGEGFILEDLEQHVYASPTPYPYGNCLNYRVTFGPGTAEYTAWGMGLEQKLTVWTDPQLPLSLRRWKIKCTDGKPHRLRLSHYVHFILGAFEKDDRFVTLKAQNNRIFASSAAFEGIACLCLLDEEAHTDILTPSQFYGHKPWAFQTNQKDNSAGAGSVALISRELSLEPDEVSQSVFLLGTAHSLEEWAAHLAFIRSQSASGRMRHLRTLWDEQLSKLQFHLPSEKMQLMMNRWLPYQVRASRLYARAGFYQAGGAIGFRDQLQDMLSLVHTHPHKVRAHLLDCAAHQFEEGDVQHWWHPPRTGVRTHISDDLLFLPYVTAWYVQRSDDATVLEEKVPYLSSPPLNFRQDDRYDTPEVTDYQETLREHCLRAIDHVALGEHGLPLMKGGDWNDGMNRVGGEHGESVWLGLFFAIVLKDFAPYAGKAETRLRTLSDDLIKAIDACAWDGEWYLRAFSNNGQPLGSAASAGCQIDNLSQSWAVLAGMPRERYVKAMESACQKLWDDSLRVMKLLDPPFAPREGAGYITGYLPGVRENGGQYTHAVPWFIWAMAELGWTEKAWEMAEGILPITHAETTEEMQRYRVEPYVMAGDVYTNPFQAGRGGWTHYTGSAAWLYTVVLEKLLGFERRGNKVRLDPKVPQEWNSFSITYQWGHSTYHFTAQGDGLPMLDGMPLADGWVSLTDDGHIHQAVFPIR